MLKAIINYFNVNKNIRQVPNKHVEVEKHEIPEDEIEDILKLTDKIISLQNSGCGCDEARYKLCKKLRDMFPYINFCRGSWAIDYSNPLCPFIFAKAGNGLIKVVRGED